MALIRRWLMIVLIAGLAGTLVELLLLRHTDGFWQLAPVVLLAAGMVVAGWSALAPRAVSVRSLQGVMSLLVLSGAVGMIQHFRGNLGYERDSNPSLSGAELYVGAQFGTGIVVIDPATQSVLHTIPTTAGVRPLEPSEDGRTIYAALSKLLGFVVVDPAARRVTRRVELGSIPEGMPQPYRDTWTHALQIANGGRELWLCDDINDLIRVIRLSDMKEVAQIRTGHFPHWFAMRPDGQVLFVSLWFSDAVAAIDVQSRKVLSNMQFELGSGPKRIAIARRIP